MKKAFLVSTNKRISQWLEQHFGITTVEYKNSDIVVFPGGLDVDPNLYNEPAGQRTSFNRGTDAEWASYYKQAVKEGKKVLGICKGSQFLTVMAGGTLFQHVNNHALPHEHGVIIDGKAHNVTSTHHQMMNPYNLEEEDFEVLAVSSERRSDIYLDGYDDDMDKPKHELEAVYYKGNGALAIQFHPEFMSSDSGIHKVIEGWIDKMIKTTPEVIFDKYKRKRSGGLNINLDKLDLGEISEEVFEEFVEHYLT